MGHLAFVALLFAPASCGEMTVYCYTPGARHRCHVSRERLESAPSWDTENTPPPVSAGKAKRLAGEWREQLFPDSETIAWRLETISLRSAGRDKWYWLVEFRGVNPKNHPQVGRPNIANLVVLMDGSVVAPVPET